MKVKHPKPELLTIVSTLIQRTISESGTKTPSTTIQLRFFNKSSQPPNWAITLPLENDLKPSKPQLCHLGTFRFQKNKLSPYEKTKIPREGQNSPSSPKHPDNPSSKVEHGNPKFNFQLRGAGRISRSAAPSNLPLVPYLPACEMLPDLKFQRETQKGSNTNAIFSGQKIIEYIIYT